MNNKGYTIIEAVVATAIFLIIAGALFGIVQIIIEGIGQTRVRHTARLLANEKIEEARNLAYIDLGTQGGIPAGPILSREQIELSGLLFTVKTAIVYVDDPFDGTAPEDTLNTDYKRIRIEVSWEGGFKSGKRPIVLVSDISPKGIETAAGGGTLSILVFNAEGEPVLSAQVKVINSQTNPQIDLTTSTDSFGRVILPGSPASIEAYEIVVTKKDYSTDRTYSREEVANPIKPHLTVLEGQVTQASFAIDKISDLKIKTYGTRVNNFPIKPFVHLKLQGSKIIGTDEDENEIYKYDLLIQSNEKGEILQENIEWDNYKIEITDPAYNLAGSSPVKPFSLLPNSNLTVLSSLASDSQNSLLVSVVNSQDTQLASASAKLVNSALEYNKVIDTGQDRNPDFGQAYFGSLSSAQYKLSVSLAGYEEATASVQVRGETFEKVILNEL